MTTTPSVGAPTYNFILVGAFRFPAGDAPSNRLLNLAKAAVAGGYRPLVVNDAPPLEDAPGSTQISDFQGIDYVCIGRGSRSRLVRLLHRTLRPFRLIRTLRRAGYAKVGCYSSIASGLYSPGVHLAFRWILKITTVSDVVERHDSEQFPRGRWNPSYLRHRWTSALCRFFPNGVIVISRRLEAVYTQSKSVLRVPPLIDIGEFGPPRERFGTEPLTLLYSGTPTRKDHLGALIDAIIDGPAFSRPVKLLIAGADAEHLASLGDVGAERVARFGTVIAPLGKVPRLQVLEELESADFTVLFRPLSGYAQAGFPSKVPESLGAGCPLLGNVTSDLGDYLKDGDNAILSPADESEASMAVVVSMLERASRLTDGELHTMKLSARKSAEQFHYERWGVALRTWLETLK